MLLFTLFTSRLWWTLSFFTCLAGDLSRSLFATVVILCYSSGKHNDDVKNELRDKQEPADDASSDSDDGESDMDTADVTGIKQEAGITSDVTGIKQEVGIASLARKHDKSTARETLVKTNTTSAKSAMRYVHLSKTTFNWMSSKS